MIQEDNKKTMEKEIEIETTILVVCSYCYKNAVAAACKEHYKEFRGESCAENARQKDTWWRNELMSIFGELQRDWATHTNWEEYGKPGFDQVAALIEKVEKTIKE